MQFQDGVTRVGVVVMSSSCKSMKLDEGTKRISGQKEVRGHCVSWGEEDEGGASAVGGTLVERKILEVT